MSVKARSFWLFGADSERAKQINEILQRQAHKPDTTTAGLDGSSVLMVAPRGEQQLDPSGSQLGPMVAPDSKSDKGGAGYGCPASCDECMAPECYLTGGFR